MKALAEWSICTLSKEEINALLYETSEDRSFERPEIQDYAARILTEKLIELQEMEDNFLFPVSDDHEANIKSLERALRLIGR